MEGKVALKALNSEMNLGSTSFLPPPAYRGKVTVIHVGVHIYDVPDVHAHL